MDSLRKRARAAERATRNAKIDLDEARDKRSRISAKLDDYENRLRALRRGREYDRLRNKYDDLQDRLMDSRAEVRRALDAHAELSERSLDLLNLVVEAEHSPRPESARRDSMPRRVYSTRTTYHYSTNDGESRESNREFHSGSRHGHGNEFDGYTTRSHGRPHSQDSHDRNDYEEHYTFEEHAPQSRRRHRHEQSERHESHGRFEDEESYTTEEHVPRSYRQHDEHPEPSAHHNEQRYFWAGENDNHRPGYAPRDPYEQHYDTEERIPQSERPKYGDDRSTHRTHSARDHCPSSEHGHHHHHESSTFYTTEEHEPNASSRSESNGSHRRSSRDEPSGDRYGHSNSSSQQGSRSGNGKDRSSRSAPPRPQTNTPQPTRLPSQQTVDSWWKYTNNCFKDYSKIVQFPMPPALSCGKPECDDTSASRPLAACECTIRASFGMVPNFNVKRERLRWHPDKFTACPANVRENFQKMASEVFIVLDKMHKESQ